MEHLRGDNTERYAWLIGGGIASLAAAVFMIRDINMKGENIHIFQRYKPSGSSQKTREEMQEDPMFPEELMSDYNQFPMLMDLLAEIPVNGEKALSGSDYSIILQSLENWLLRQGVVFKKITYIEDLEFTTYADTEEKVIKSIHYITEGKEYIQETGFEDMVIVTGGYITDMMDLDMPFHISIMPLEIRPAGYHNLAFASHLTEKQKDDKQFTPEETVQSAKKAVFELLGIKE